MKIDFYKYIVGGAVGVVFSLITYIIIQKYSAEPQTPLPHESFRVVRT